MDNNNKTGKLSLEQQFHLQILINNIENLNLEQARDALAEAFRQLMIKENLCKQMFKECYL